MEQRKAEWLCAVGGMAGAALCSTGHMPIGYPIFLMGSVAGVYAFRASLPTVLQFAFFSVANLIGVFNFTIGGF